jgi:hypothetical protein
MNYSGASTIQTSTKPLNNLTLSHASCNVDLVDALTVAGALTITSGELDTSGSNYALTVTGDTSITGTLTLNGSTVVFVGNVTGAGTLAADTATVTAGNLYPSLITADAATITCGDYFGVAANTALTISSGAQLAVFCRKPQLTTITAPSPDWSVTINGDQATREIKVTSGEYHDLILNMTSDPTDVLTLATALTIGGNLTITSGVLDTGSDRALTVTGDVDINGSSSVLTTNASEVTVRAISTTSSGLYNATTHANGTIVTGRHAILGRGLSCGSVDSVTHNNGKFVFQGSSTGGTQGILINGTASSTKGLYDVEINSTATHDCLLQGAVQIYRNLTITAGELDTHATHDYALTVDGYCDVLGAGILTLNGSVVSLDGLRTQSGAKMTQDADGTLDLAAGGGSNFAGTEGSSYSWRNEDGTSDINLGGTLTVSGGSYFEPRTTPTYASVVNNWVWNTGAYWVGKITVGGTLVVNAGKTLQTYGGSDSIVVTGDVTVNGHLKATSGYLAAGLTGEMTFGSLTIPSGGTYTATPNTTTIVGAGTLYAGANPEIFKNQGTLVHNGGTFLNTVGKNHKWFNLGSGNFYNLIMTTGASYDMYQASSDSAYGGTPIVYEGDVTINTGNFRGSSNTQAGTVLGKFTLTGANCNFDGRMGDWSFGSITTGASSTFTATTGIITVTGGLRESDFGGTLSHSYYSTAASGADHQTDGQWAIGGTGALFEGDFLKNWNGLRINQDKSLDFTNTASTYINCGNRTEARTVPFSVSWWVKYDTAADDGEHMISKDGSWGCYIDSSNRVRFDYTLGTAGAQYVRGGANIVTSGGWHHIALTLDADFNAAVYINGVSVGTEGPDAGDTLNNTTDPFLIGGSIGFGGNHWNGRIADVKIYDSIISAAELAKLSSKMNIGVGSPVGWWKLNEETASGGGAGTGYIPDASKNNNQGTINAGTSWIYNDFGVDIQDNTTTVSNLIVENGQLNTKALNSLDCEAGSDTLVKFTEFNIGTVYTLSGWVNHESTGGVQTYFGGNSANEYFSIQNSLDDLFFRPKSVVAAVEVDISDARGAALSTGVWYNIGVSRNGTAVEFYIDGVKVGATQTLASDQAHAMDALFAEHDSDTAYDFDGKARDFRIYDHALSADQMMSLYRGSYNVTPLHWWKFDEGHATAALNNAVGAFADSGTATAANGQGVNFVDASGINGSLKVNGAARVMTNGSVL